MKNTITKLLCVAMVLCMLLTFTACGVAGTYVLSEAKINGEKYDLDEMEDLGIDPDDCYIELKSDGTGEVSLFGEETDIEWEDDEMWPEDDEDDVLEFEIDGDELILEMEGQELIFVKE